MFISRRFKFPNHSLSRVGAVGICAVLAVTVFSGCGGDDGYSGPRGNVSGRVTHQGQPVPAGTRVEFISDQGIMPTAVVDEDGQYTLLYHGKKDIPALTYKVQVSEPVVTQEISAAESAAAPPEDPKPLFPARYRSAATSGIEVTVTEGENTTDITMTE